MNVHSWMYTLECYVLCNVLLNVHSWMYTLECYECYDIRHHRISTFNNFIWLNDCIWIIAKNLLFYVIWPCTETCYMLYDLFLFFYVIWPVYVIWPLCYTWPLCYICYIWPLCYMTFMFMLYDLPSMLYDLLCYMTCF